MVNKKKRHMRFLQKCELSVIKSLLSVPSPNYNIYSIFISS